MSADFQHLCLCRDCALSVACAETTTSLTIWDRYDEKNRKPLHRHFITLSLFSVSIIASQRIHAGELAVGGEVDAVVVVDNGGTSTFSVSSLAPSGEATVQL